MSNRKNPVLHWNNLLIPATITQSSEKTDFEASNVIDWRTFTRWKTDKVLATVTGGGAPGDLQFVAASTKIVGPGTPWSGMIVGHWVVITGATNGANNGTFEITGISGTDLTIANTAMVDEDSSTAVVKSAHDITFDLGSSLAADALGIVGHDLKTQNATYKLQTADDLAFTTNVVDQVTHTPSDDGVIYKEFTSISRQYWRILITAADADTQIGIIVVGPRFTFTQLQSPPYDRLPQEIVRQTVRSRRGHILGAKEQFKVHPIRANFELYKDADFAAFESIFDSGLSADPFLWIWDPGDHPSEAIFAQFRNGFTLRGDMDLDRRTFQLDMESVKDD